MSVSRANFLKSLGKSVTGLALGTGVATAAQALAGKFGPIREAESTSPPVEKAVPFHTSGPGEGNRIALTFDDGPTPGVTEIVLEELGKRKLHTTFFMVGQRVLEAPELARRVATEGHEIGNHTFNHLKLTTLSDQRVDEELQQLQETLGETVGFRPVWLRPPYGALRKNQAGIAERNNLGVVLWNIDAHDWSQPGVDAIVETVLTGAAAGSIVLCHDLHRQTAESLPQILDGLQERGFNFVTVSRLLGSVEREQRA